MPGNTIFSSQYVYQNNIEEGSLPAVEIHDIFVKNTNHRGFLIYLSILAIVSHIGYLFLTKEEMSGTWQVLAFVFALLLVAAQKFNQVKKGGLPHVKNLIIEARTITSFIYNRSFLLAAMRKEYCGGDLVRPGVTRFATNFLALQSLKSKRDGLRKLFSGVEWSSMKESRTAAGGKIEDIVNSRSFWERVNKILRIMEPIVKVLMLVDGDKSPAIPYLYEAMTLMTNSISKVVPRGSAQYKKIIRKRWEKMLLHPMHKAERVIILPSFGIQLETHYRSGRIRRRFVPIAKILRPVLNECVTPVTCYWSLSLICHSEDVLMLVFKELQPPAKLLVPIWKALCAAVSCTKPEI